MELPVVGRPRTDAVDQEIRSLNCRDTVRETLIVTVWLVSTRPWMFVPVLTLNSSPQRVQCPEKGCGFRSPLRAFLLHSHGKLLFSNAGVDLEALRPPRPAGARLLVLHPGIPDLPPLQRVQGLRDQLQQVRSSGYTVSQDELCRYEGTSNSGFICHDEVEFA